MRWPKPRISLKAWLLVVALVAVVLFLLQRRQLYLERAAFHDQKAWGYRVTGNQWLSIAEGYVKRDAGEAVERHLIAEQNWTRSAYHLRLSKKYGYAAAHPWLPLPRDPPPPQ